MAIQTVAEAIPPQVSHKAPADALTSHAMLMVRGAYLEIPSLHLTPSQVQRLWGFDARSAGTVLESLLEWRFLERTPGGAFVRAGGSRS